MTTVGAGDAFLGHYRLAVKTSIWRVNGSIAPVQEFQDIGTLIGSVPPDSVMKQRPGLRMSPTATNEEKLAAAPIRFPEEQINVTMPAYLWFVRKETDNDYHLILGSTADQGATYMTAEVSGLPPDGPDLATLSQVRGQLAALVGQLDVSETYDRQTPPRPVQVTGSLFFDGDHTAGEVGPTGFRPQTVWEIHPVTDLRVR
jgi:hypothetical protein